MPQPPYDPASPWKEIYSSTKMFYADELLRHLFDDLPVTAEGVKQALEQFPKILTFLQRIIDHESDIMISSTVSHLIKYMKQVQTHYTNKWHISPNRCLRK